MRPLEEFLCGAHRALQQNRRTYHMIRTKLFLAGALALMFTFAGTSAFSQEPANQITYFTFSAPFELPGGQTLPAGKYMFRILDAPGSRHVVQITSEDRKTV